MCIVSRSSLSLRRRNSRIMGRVALTTALMKCTVAVLSYCRRTVFTPIALRREPKEGSSWRADLVSSMRTARNSRYEMRSARACQSQTPGCPRNPGAKASAGGLRVPQQPTLAASVWCVIAGVHTGRSGRPSQSVLVILQHVLRSRTLWWLVVLLSPSRKIRNEGS